MALDKGRLTPSQTMTRARAKGANVRVISNEPGFSDTVFQDGSYVVTTTAPEREGQMIAKQDTTFKKFQLYVAVTVDLPNINDGPGGDPLPGQTQLQWKQVRLFSRVLDSATGLPWDPLTAS